MIKTNPEFIPEAMHEPVRENLLRDTSIDDGINQTHERINKIVRTTTPSAPATSTTPAPVVHAPSTGASVSTEAPHPLHHEGSEAPHTGESKNFARNATLGIAGGVGALAVAGAYPSYLSSFPLIGKIPYLTQVATWLNTAISSLAQPLGLGTGTQAINSVFAGLPYIGVLPTAVGATLTGVAAIPAALWGIGILKSILTGQKYSAVDGPIWGNIKEAGRTIGGLPFMAYDRIIRARNWTGGKVASGFNNIVKTPIAGAWNLTKKIATSAWHTTATTTSNVLKPTKLGVGGAILGGILAASTAGAAAPAIAAAGLGYGFSNWLKNSGAMNGSGSAAAAHAH